MAVLSGCVSTKEHEQVVDSYKRLQESLSKEREDNAQLSSFRFSLETQFREKSKQYEECQEDSKETVQSMTKRYNELQVEYQKLSESYKQLNLLYDQTRQNDGRIIADLEQRLKVAMTRRSYRRR